MSSAPSNKFLPSPKTVALRCSFRQGPIHLVQAGLINQVEELRWRVVFDGHYQFEDISPLPNGIQVNATTDDTKSPLLVAQVCESVASAVQARAKMGHLPVTLGGDHFRHPEVSISTYDHACVIWIDPHADINTIYSADCGKIHGMPLSFLLKLNPPAPSPDSRLVYIGLRDVEKGEKEILKKHRIKAFSMHEVDRYGIGKLTLDHVNLQRDCPTHLSFDLDALDPSVAPSTGTPAVHETGLLVALDLMEVKPTLADAGSVHQTVTVGCSLVRSTLGKSSI
ncbi:Ureohydrolase [Suillus decipiens]|nr:Ureohydrolase [Suillus decipiens]